uniref:Uncharacterized protein n=1 Tax=Candidatus Kentrum sp. LFY TaxID=2126342 RepID=A0A450UR66_9GAMM|nr:MAG: hypothetical protein BECKLFY1418A_GA0070994_10466 [Candidatus Kentron sp. LFY]
MDIDGISLIPALLYSVQTPKTDEGHQSTAVTVLLAIPSPALFTATTQNSSSLPYGWQQHGTFDSSEHGCELTRASRKNRTSTKRVGNNDGFHRTEKPVNGAPSETMTACFTRFLLGYRAAGPPTGNREPG